MTFPRVQIILPVCALVCLCRFVGGAEYSITSLALPPGTLPSALNNIGHVVGRYEVANDAYHAFLYKHEDGGLLDLGTLGGQSSHAFDINDLDQVVGAADSTIPGKRAFVWTASHGMRDLGPGNAYAINESSFVAGDSNSINGIVHAFVWESVNRPIDLETLGGPSSSAFGINDFGLVVGASGTTPVNSPNHAFLWSPSVPMRTLQTPSGSASFAASINNLGDAAGEVAGEAVIWLRSGEALTLGLPTGNYSTASSINEQSQVVGFWYENTTNQRAFLWEADNGSRDLLGLLPTNSGWTHLYSAQDINDRGQIVGVGSYNGASHVFLMTPIPEPSALLTSFVAAAAIAFMAAGVRLFRRNAEA